MYVFTVIYSMCFNCSGLLHYAGLFILLSLCNYICLSNEKDQSLGAIYVREHWHSRLQFDWSARSRGHVFSWDRPLDNETRAYSRRLADSVDRSSV